MNKLIYLGMPILEISKKIKNEFLYDFIKPKYGDKAGLCYMNTDKFVVQIKTKRIYKDTAYRVKKKDLMFKIIKLKESYQQVEIKE